MKQCYTESFVTSIPCTFLVSLHGYKAKLNRLVERLENITKVDILEQLFVHKVKGSGVQNNTGSFVFRRKSYRFGTTRG